MRSCRSRTFAAVLIASLVGAPSAHAGDDTPTVTEARDAFVRGTDAGKRAQWAEALQAFERSAKLRPHPVTTFNIGVCQRAMGSYTLARDTLLRAIAENEAAGGGELAESLVAEDRAFVAQIDELLATAKVSLEPATAIVTVDGRPLAARGEGDAKVMIAGVREPGRGEPAPGKNFRVLMNPGVHVITLARPGFAEAVISRSVTPGTTFDLNLQLDRLPAVMHVVADQEGAIVTVDDRDVGSAPVDVSRPAGRYRVTVSKPGFKRYEADVPVQPGQEVSLNASLVKDEPSILTRWWFWTISGAVVVGAGVGTYALTRQQTTTQEPVSGGGLGWAVKLR